MEKKLTAAEQQAAAFRAAQVKGSKGTPTPRQVEEARKAKVWKDAVKGGIKRRDGLDDESVALAQQRAKAAKLRTVQVTPTAGRMVASVKRTYKATIINSGKA